MFRLNRTPSLSLSWLAAIFILAGCSGGKSDIKGTWYQEQAGEFSLEITGDAISVGDSVQRMKATYTVVKSEGNATTVQFTIDGLEKGECTFTVAEDGKSLTASGDGPFDGKWVKDKPAANAG
jgi:hypothetical protein